MAERVSAGRESLAHRLIDREVVGGDEQKKGAGEVIGTNRVFAQFAPGD